MNLSKTWVAFVGLALSAGCSSQTSPPKSLGGYQQQELAEERDEFIRDSEARLTDLDKEIDHLGVKIEHEARFVDEDQRAEWSQDLFDAKQERQRVAAELQRARSASDAEWAQMRGTLGGAIDTVEAVVAKIRGEVMHAMSSDGSDRSDADEDTSEETAKIPADSGLCAFDFPGVDADVTEEEGKAVLRLTASEDTAVKKLRDGAKKITTKSSYRGATAENATELSVASQTKNIEGGIEITFKPKREDDMSKLVSYLEEDAAALGTGRCEVAPGATTMR